MYLVSYLLDWLKSLFQKKYISNKTTACFDSLQMKRKVITISPCGYYGFYMIGVCNYIKEHYDTSEYIFSGASAGALASFTMTFKGKHEIIKDVLVNNEIYKNKSIYEIVRIMKQNLLNTFTSDDFDLDRLFIGVTTIGQTNIHFDFDSLEDAVDCVLASSNIPFITGPLLYTYKNSYAFDGNFSASPYVDSEVALHIHPNIWGQNSKIHFNIYKKDYYNVEELCSCGYEDTKLYGKETLDKVFDIYK